MLGAIRLRVSYINERTCFAYVNPKHSSKNEQNQCIQVIYRDKQVFLWVVFTNNISENEVACNPIFSKLVGLEEGIDVFVTPYVGINIIEELYIDTDSPEDQDILEHNVEILQLHLLDQLRLVVANQKSVVWISVSLPIIFTPKQTGILVNNSKIIIKVDAFNDYRAGQRNTAKRFDASDDGKFNNLGKINNGMLKPYLHIPEKLIFRAVPIDSDGKRNLIHPYTVFIHEDFIPYKYKEKTVILATIENIPSVVKDESIDENEEDTHRQIPFSDQICVEIVLIDNIVFRSLCHEIFNINIATVLISKSLNNIINVENGMKVILTLLNSDMHQPEHIEAVIYSDKPQVEEEVIEKFKKCVIESTNSGKKFVINNNLIKQNSDICDGLIQFKLKPDKLKYTMLNPESFRTCTVSAKCLSENDMVPCKHITNTKNYDYKNLCCNIRGFATLIGKIIIHISFEVQREASFRGVSEIKSNILLTGSNGTGKSSLCQMIQSDLTMWCHILHCRSLKGRKDITEILSKAIIMCQEHGPAVLICDDIDSLVPPNMESSSPQDIAYYQRLAVVMKRILQSCSGVCVLMTALSVSSLHPILREVNGKPLYTSHFEMPSLDQSDRVELFKHLLNERVKDEFTIADDDVVRLATETDGHNVRDLTDYLNKKIFKAVKRKNMYPENVKPCLIEDLRNDKEKTDAFDVWDSVGGMDAVKQELTECIFWPIMYPALFPSQSCGILLYGPPGTGKSYIGSCLAKVKNMNFLAVKGPELLSKYIGQSEKAVRDIFDKADSKRPCILFFDEFDALAPRRGHDSTGVTDRVVNQLLSRLDGAEGGVRYPVLAATARPDLLDPALLRAGRLQRHLYCALPDKSGRREVLRNLAMEINISNEIDLEDIALRTEGFSPADLKSLLVTAQLGRLERQLDSNDERPLEGLVVQIEDMEAALSETKPSLSEEQRLFYDVIYKRFRGENLSPQERIMSSELQKERVTLA